MKTELYTCNNLVKTMVKGIGLIEHPLEHEVSHWFS